MWHTLPEAIKLTGRSRRSIYRDMDAGRVSYRVGTDGRRELETSELMRAYGALAQVAQPEAQSVAHSGTADGTPPDAMAEAIAAAVAKAVAEAVEPLRKEIEQLRETMLLIEHKPQRKGYDEREGFEPSSRTSEESDAPAREKMAGGNQPPSGTKVSSFADLVHRFNSRH